MSRQHLKYALLIVLATLLAVFLYGRIDHSDPIYTTWELHDYRVMADAAPNFTNVVRQPFAFRVLGPYLVGLTPFSVDRGFCLVSTAATVLLAFLFYLFLSHTLVPPSIAAFTTLLFVFNKYLFGFPSWNFYHVNDVLVNILILLAFWMMLLEKWGWFGLFLLLGSLAKEPALLLIPAAFYYAREKRFTPGTWSILVLACVPAVAAWLALRLSIHPIAGSNLLEAFHEYSSKAFRFDTWFRLLINSTIPVSLFPVVYLSSTRSYFQSRRYALVFLGLVLLSTVFGLNNERLMSPAFIIFYSLIAYVVNDVRLSTSNHFLTTWAVGAAIVSSVHHTYARFPLPREWSIVISISAFVILTTIAYMFTRRVRDDALHITQDAARRHV